MPHTQGQFWGGSWTEFAPNVGTDITNDGAGALNMLMCKRLSTHSLVSTSHRPQRTPQVTRTSVKRHSMRDDVTVVMTTSDDEQVPRWRHASLVGHHVLDAGAVAAGTVQHVQVWPTHLQPAYVNAFHWRLHLTKLQTIFLCYGYSYKKAEIKLN